MTAQFRNIVTCILGFGLALGCLDDVTPTQRVIAAASGCTNGPPSAGEYAMMSAYDRLVFMQTQKAAQENVARAIRREERIRPCDAAWAIAPR